MRRQKKKTADNAGDEPAPCHTREAKMMMQWAGLSGCTRLPPPEKKKKKKAAPKKPAAPNKILKKEELVCIAQRRREEARTTHETVATKTSGSSNSSGSRVPSPPAPPLATKSNIDAATSIETMEMCRFKKLKATELRACLGSISVAEREYLRLMHERRRALQPVDVAVLRKTLMLNGYGKGSNLSKDGMIDFILHKKLELAVAVVFDEDQERFFSKKQEPLLLLVAGPGSGKTTSLAKFACNLAKQGPGEGGGGGDDATDDNARVLIVMFNVGAEKSMITKIETLDGTVKQARDWNKVEGRFNPWEPQPGITCMTFNKLAYRIITKATGKVAVFGQTNKTDNNNNNNKNDAPAMTKGGGTLHSYLVPVAATPVRERRDNMCELEDQLPEAAGILGKRPLGDAWDWILIDEAQDITGKYVDFVEHLRKGARHVVVAGDPRQEIYTASRWFSDLWATSPSHAKYVMRYNHRSKPNIVAALNAYSRYCFPTLHHEQQHPAAAAHSSPSSTSSSSSSCPSGCSRVMDSAPNQDDVVATPDKHRDPEKDDDHRTEQGQQEQQQKEQEQAKPPCWSWVFGQDDIKEAIEQEEQNKVFNAAMDQEFKRQEEATEEEEAAEENKAQQSSSSAPLSFGATMRDKGGGGVVTVIRASRDDLSLAITNELLKHHPTSIYILTPVTTRKFGMGSVFMGVKNMLVERGCLYPLQALAEEAKYNAADHVYYAGSARKLKGTERRVVLVVGADLPYTNYGIEESEYRKALFVCFSRAIEQLIVLIPNDARIGPASPLAQIIKCDKAQVVFRFSSSLTSSHHDHDPEQRRPLLNYCRVKDDLSTARAIPFECKPEMGTTATPTTTITTTTTTHHVEQLLQVIRPAALDALRIRFHEDFVGLYIEARLALKLKAKNIEAWEAIVQRPHTNLEVLTRYGTRVADSRGRFLETLPDKTHRLLLRYTETKEVPPEIVACKDRAYVLCVLSYTSQIGKWWVASREVLVAAQTIGPELDTLLDSLPRSLGLLVEDGGKELRDNNKDNTRASSAPVVVWGQPLRTDVLCERPDRRKAPVVACQVVGIADLDLVAQHLFLEIKFARHKEAHLRQTAIYAAMLGKPGLLVNLQEGKVFHVEMAQSDSIGRLARAHLAIKNGKLIRMGKRIKLEDTRAGNGLRLAGAVLVALDVETDGFPPHAPLMEVAGAAWYFGTDDVDSVFCQVAKDCHALLEASSPPSSSSSSSCCPVEPRVPILICGLQRRPENDDKRKTNNHNNKSNHNENTERQTEKKKDKTMDRGRPAELALQAEARNWFTAVRGRKIGLVWGACGDYESSGIDLDKSQIINLHAVYLDWLTLNDAKRKSNTSLSAAAQHLFGEDIPWKPHRAYDDVCMVMAIANAVLDFGGTT